MRLSAGMRLGRLLYTSTGKLSGHGGLLQGHSLGGLEYFYAPNGLAPATRSFTKGAKRMLIRVRVMLLLSSRRRCLKLVAKRFRSELTLFLFTHDNPPTSEDRGRFPRRDSPLIAPTCMCEVRVKRSCATALYCCQTLIPVIEPYCVLELFRFLALPVCNRFSKPIDLGAFFMALDRFTNRFAPWCPFDLDHNTGEGSIQKVPNLVKTAVRGFLTNRLR